MRLQVTTNMVWSIQWTTSPDTLLGAPSHFDNSNYFVATIPTELSSDVQLWIRTRLFREQDGIREIGGDPSSVLISKICSASFTSSQCQSLMCTCAGDCKFEEFDDIFFMFRKSGSAT